MLSSAPRLSDRPEESDNEITHSHESQQTNEDPLDYLKQSLDQRSRKPLIQRGRAIAPRKPNSRILQIQKLAERLPPLLDPVLQQSVPRHERADVRVVPLVSCLRVALEVAVEENLPRAQEGRASPAGWHAQQIGYRDEAFRQGMGDAALAGLEARSAQVSRVERSQGTMRTRTPGASR